MFGCWLIKKPGTIWIMLHGIAGNANYTGFAGTNTIAGTVISVVWSCALNERDRVENKGFFLSLLLFQNLVRKFALPISGLV